MRVNDQNRTFVYIDLVVVVYQHHFHFHYTIAQTYVFYILVARTIFHSFNALTCAGLELTFHDKVFCLQNDNKYCNTKHITDMIINHDKINQLVINIVIIKWMSIY